MSINSFTARQISQVRDGGWDVVKRKAVRIPLYVFAIPIVLFARIMRPFIQIRFGSIENRLIGDFAFETEYYLTDRVVNQSKPLDFYYLRASKSPNEQWEIMVKRKIKIHPLIRYFDKVNHFITGGKKHYACLIPEGSRSRDTNGLLRNTKVQIGFTKEENERGRSFLAQVGMRPDQHFVCIIARDPAYKDMTWLNRNWSYHDYRNSDIDNYEKAALTLAGEGYYVFRMGKVVEKVLKCKHKRFVDYATSEFRDDFLDIYLSSKCRFFINGESGLCWVPMTLRVPIVFVNLAAIEYCLTWNDNIISIPKKYWLKDKKRYMRFKEIYDCGAGRFLHTELYEQLGIELIENTPDEILAVNIEMHQRLNGTWEITEEDEALQKRFWDMFPKSELHGDFRARIGADFLRHNKDLLY